MSKQKRAFTLAEVLITLGIIGIVSALTLPTIIQEYQKQVTVNQLKKGYNIFQNATQQAYYEHGDFSNWDTLPLINSGNPNAEIRKKYNDFVKKYYGNYIFITKDNYRNGIKSVGNVHVHYVNSATPWYYLKDGSCFAVRITAGQYYFNIDYDINGDKGPNRYGRDIFVFRAYRPAVSKKSGTLQFGGSTFPLEVAKTNSNWFSRFKDDCNKNNTEYSGGRSCGALIEDNNWKIPDGYPW